MLFFFWQWIGHLISYSRFYELVRCWVCFTAILWHAAGRSPSLKADALGWEGCGVCALGYSQELGLHWPTLPAGTLTPGILGLAVATTTNKFPDLGESGEDQISGLGSEFVSWTKVGVFQMDQSLKLKKKKTKVTLSDPQYGSIPSPEDTRHNTQYWVLPLVKSSTDVYCEPPIYFKRSQYFTSSKLTRKNISLLLF